MDNEKGAHGSNNDQCEDIKILAKGHVILSETVKGLAEQVGKIDYTVKEHGDELKEIKEFQGGTKVYVVEIKDQLNRMEERLFIFMGDLVKNLTAKDATVATAEASVESTKATTNMQKWDKTLTTLKDIVKIVVPGVIGYLAAKGVK